MKTKFYYFRAKPKAGIMLTLESLREVRRCLLELKKRK